MRHQLLTTAGPLLCVLLFQSVQVQAQQTSDGNRPPVRLANVGYCRISTLTTGCLLKSDRPYKVIQIPSKMVGAAYLLRDSVAANTGLKGEVVATADCTAYVAVMWNWIGNVMVPDNAFHRLEEQGWKPIDDIFESTTTGTEKWLWRVLSKPIKAGTGLEFPNPSDKDGATLLFAFSPTASTSPSLAGQPQAQQRTNSHAIAVLACAENEDARSRWLNTSYNTTIYQVQGSKWAEIDNTTQKIKWYFDENDRTSAFIELLNTTRGDTTRLLAERMDVKAGDGWKWVSNGNWESVPQKESVIAAQPTDPKQRWLAPPPLGASKQDYIEAGGQPFDDKVLNRPYGQINSVSFIFGPRPGTYYSWLVSFQNGTAQQVSFSKHDVSVTGGTPTLKNLPLQGIEIESLTAQFSGESSWLKFEETECNPTTMIKWRDDLMVARSTGKNRENTIFTTRDFGQMIERTAIAGKSIKEPASTTPDPKNSICKQCKGAGFIRMARRDIGFDKIRCSECGGTGRNRDAQRQQTPTRDDTQIEHFASPSRPELYGPYVTVSEAVEAKATLYRLQGYQMDAMMERGSGTLSTHDWDIKYDRDRQCWFIYETR